MTHIPKDIKKQIWELQYMRNIVVNSWKKKTTYYVELDWLLKVLYLYFKSKYGKNNRSRIK